MAIAEPNTGQPATPVSEYRPEELSQGPLRVDIDAVLRRRLPRQYGRIPRFLIRWLEHTICQDGLNELLENNYPMRGADFCEGVLRDLGITYEVTGEEEARKGSRVILVSNHPLGALDGITMIQWASKLFGMPARFVVNDLLMAVEPLQDVFLPVNKFGRQSRRTSTDIETVFASDVPIVVFPAGLCSRKVNGKIEDLKWYKMFVNKAIQHHRDVIPVHFGGRNSAFFYNFAMWRKRIGLKFNIEQMYLPREIFRNKGARFTITLGHRIPWQELQGGQSAQAEAQRIRSIVYDLDPHKK